MHTVKRAAEMTGITPDTLRAWERRYGVVTPQRSSGGYRLYDQQALRRLATMRDLVEAGWSPRNAAAQVLADATLEAGTPGPGALGEDDEPLGDILALARAGRYFDVAGLQGALDEGFSLGSFETVVDRWLMPSLCELGRSWYHGEVTVAGEHFVSASVQRRLAAAYDAAGRSSTGPRVVVGLGRESRHELGVLAFATALRRAGADVLYVGSDLPPSMWPAAVLQHHAVAAVLGVPTVEDVPTVRETATALTGAAPEVRLYVGGSRQGQIEQGIALGHRIGAGAAELVEELREVAGAAASSREAAAPVTDEGGSRPVD